ncbi:MAG: sugar phosphate isomerase/epimerase [Verrucomicrobium sp.]|nr:sugar phosphate isomerase/epimerase [Verrucomicrobium sp.]
MSFPSLYCGIGDEAGNRLESQIQAAHDLGWKHLEARNITLEGFPKANLHDLPDAAFDRVEEMLGRAGVSVYCFASTIGNWAKNVEDPFEITLAEVERAIPRMRRLGSRYVRVMSYKVTRRFLDAGIQPLHENCMNYGGMSWRHALRLLEAVPGLKWVFDTANPVFNPDRTRPEPRPRQDPWEFWTQVRDVSEHIHIKDARWVTAKNDADYHWPGEGDGAVQRILEDAFRRGYAGALSIEPHMVAVFHDASGAAVPPPDEALRANFVEYGRRLVRMVDGIAGGAAGASAGSP